MKFNLTILLLFVISQAYASIEDISHGDYMDEDMEESKKKKNITTDLQKYISEDSGVMLINSSSAWNTFTPKQKNYAYYLSEASWAGAKMVLHQISYEAPALF